MRTPSHPTLIRRVRQGRLTQLGRVPPFVAASLVAVAVRCGRSGCHCATGKGHPSWHLTLKRAGKTATLYVSQAQLPEVRQAVEAYQVVKQLLREISDLTVADWRAQARLKRIQRRRR